jgi:Protein kinase domain.
MFAFSHITPNRDLKPENFLYLNDADDAPLKVIDFGLSKISQANNVMTTRAGTVRNSFFL